MTSKTLSPLVGDSAQHGDDAEESSVAQPADQSDFYNLAFYNIGSDSMENVVDDPAAKICDMIYAKCIDSMSISGAFNVKDDRLQQLQAMMEKVVWKLNNDDGRSANLVNSRAEQPAWTSHIEAHYACVWNTHRLALTLYEYLQKQPSTMSHYLKFQQAQRPSGPPLHFYHHCDTVRHVPPLVVSVRPG